MSISLKELPAGAGWFARELNASSPLAFNLQMAFPQFWEGCFYANLGGFPVAACGDGLGAIAWSGGGPVSLDHLPDQVPFHGNVTWQADPGRSIPALMGVVPEGAPVQAWLNVTSETPFSTGRASTGELHAAWAPWQFEAEGFVQVGSTVHADRLVREFELATPGNGFVFIDSELHHAQVRREAEVVWRHDGSPPETYGSAKLDLPPGKYAYEITGLDGTDVSLGYVALSMPAWARAAATNDTSTREGGHGVARPAHPGEPVAALGNGRA